MNNRKEKANEMLWNSFICNPAFYEEALAIRKQTGYNRKIRKDDNCPLDTVYGIDEKGSVTTYLFTNKES